MFKHIFYHIVNTINMYKLINIVNVNYKIQVKIYFNFFLLQNLQIFN